MTTRVWTHYFWRCRFRGRARCNNMLAGCIVSTTISDLSGSTIMWTTTFRCWAGCTIADSRAMPQLVMWSSRRRLHPIIQRLRTHRGELLTRWARRLQRKARISCNLFPSSSDRAVPLPPRRASHVPFLPLLDLTSGLAQGCLILPQPASPAVLGRRDAPLE